MDGDLGGETGASGLTPFCKAGELAAAAIFLLGDDGARAEPEELAETEEYVRSIGFFRESAGLSGEEGVRAEPEEFAEADECVLLIGRLGDDGASAEPDEYVLAGFFREEGARSEPEENDRLRDLESSTSLLRW